MEWEEYRAALVASEVRSSRTTKKAYSPKDLMYVTGAGKPAPQRPQLKPGEKDPVFYKMCALMEVQRPKAVQTPKAET